MNRFASLALGALLLAGCGEALTPLRPTPADPPQFTCDPEAEPPAVESLQWKRVAAFTADLSTALELSDDALCNEVDAFPCRDVHLVALGGNDPYGAAQYEPVATPLATTPTAVDRVVLAACENAVARDESGAPAVFTELAPTAEPADPAALTAQAEALYRRLLARDAEPDELALIAELAFDPMGVPRSAREADVLACFAIGSTTENLLF